MKAFDWLTRRIRRRGKTVGTITESDNEWLDLHVRAAQLGLGRVANHGNIPFLPGTEEQIRFTGRSGKDNLLQAFEFYKFLRTQLLAGGPIDRSDNILDFGCGWGRVGRFWSREIDPSSLWCADCLDDAINLLRQTELEAHILQNAPFPPIENLTSKFRLIYAYSVFSHLSESAANSWVEYFSALLIPGGQLVITTRGRDYIELLARLRRESSSDPHLSRLLQLAPPQEEIESRYAKGDFVFFPTGGGGQLTDDFYGEAMIPAEYAKKYVRYGLQFSGAFENVPLVDQNVLVFAKPLA